MDVLLSVVEDPHLSSAEIGENLNIGRSSVKRILKSNMFHPYHIQLYQKLLNRDFEPRQQFCEWVNLIINGNPDFFENVLFSDEATFHNNGHINKHNLHYYDRENPHFLRSIDHQYRWSIN